MLCISNGHRRFNLQTSSFEVILCLFISFLMIMISTITKHMKLYYIKSFQIYCILQLHGCLSVSVSLCVEVFRTGVLNMYSRQAKHLHQHTYSFQILLLVQPRTHIHEYIFLVTIVCVLPVQYTSVLKYVRFHTVIYLLNYL